MNFLAHLYLADDTPESMIGNLLPDFVRGRLLAAYEPGVQEGIRRHRQVDAFTDTHPVFLRSRQRVFSRFGRYAGILVDIFYDHVLAVEWSRYCAEPYEPFSAKCYDLIASRPDLIAGPAEQPLRSLIAHDWLQSYRSPAGIRFTLDRLSARLSRRFRREVVLGPAATLLAAEYAAFAADFDRFFPELIRHAGGPERRPSPDAIS